MSKDLGDTGAGGKIAGYHQALAQHGHIRIGHSKPKLLGGGHNRPAALRDDVGVLADRPFDVEDGLLREDRQVDLDFVALAGARVERVVPVAPAFGLQDVGDHVLRADRTGKRRHRQHARAGKEETSARLDRHSWFSSRHRRTAGSRSPDIMAASVNN